MKKSHFFFIVWIITGLSQYSNATIWKVGAARTYTMPSQVAGLVNNGDTVDIDAGMYSNCATWNANNLLLRGVGGMAHVKDVVCSGKGIWNFNGNNITVEYIEFSGATNPSLNGAGIRGQGGAFTVRHSYFHDNENGILCNDPVAGTSDVLVEYTEFANNGQGDGYSHNMYIGNMNSFTLRYCYTHHAKIGHEIKSRANKNYILYNRIMNETAGTASREIDLPNGGLAIIIGNLIEQGSNTSNSNMVGYGLEGLSNPGPQDVYVINNTFVNDRSAGTFIQTQAGTGILKVVNNIFTGPGTIINGTPTTLDSTTNWIITNKASLAFVNLTGYNYQLTASSPVINKGSNPGSAGTYSLSPVSEYVHNSDKRNKTINGTIDIGAYEYNPTTGINQQTKQISLFVFPNPASNKLEIISDSENAKLSISNILGEQIMIKLIHEKSTTIDVSNWLQGVYFIRIQTDANMRTEKIQIVR